MGSVQRPRRGGRWTLGYRIAQCRLQDRPEYFSLLVMPEFRVGGSYLGGQYGASLPGKHEVGSAVSDPSVAGVVAADGDDAIAHRAVDFATTQHDHTLAAGIHHPNERSILQAGQAHELAPARKHDLVRAVDTAAAQRSEEHTSELQSLMRISYAVFCLKKKK